MTELLGPPACGKTSLVLPALARLTRSGGLAAYVDPAAEAYPPAFAAAGVELERLLFVRPRGALSPPTPARPRSASRISGSEALPPNDALWATEVLLQSGCFEAVLLDADALALSPHTGAERQFLERRAIVLRAAAETHGAALIVLGREPLGAPPLLRLRVTPGRVTVEKSRHGWTGQSREIGSGTPRQEVGA